MKLEPENSIQKLITKYPAPMARKKDIAKTRKYRLEVLITVIKRNRDRDVGHEINGVDDDGIPSPTQVGAVPQVSRGSESELDGEINLTAADNTDHDFFRDNY